MIKRFLGDDDADKKKWKYLEKKYGNEGHGWGWNNANYTSNYKSGQHYNNYEGNYYNAYNGYGWGKSKDDSIEDNWDDSQDSGAKEGQIPRKEEISADIEQAKKYLNGGGYINHKGSKGKDKKKDGKKEGKKEEGKKEEKKGGLPPELDPNTKADAAALQEEA